MKNSSKVVLVAFIYFLIAMLQTVFGAILDKIALAFDVPVAVAGQLSAVYALSLALGTPVLMVLAARMDQKRLFLAALAALALGALATALVPGFGWLLVIQAFVGMAAGVATVTGTTIITHTVAPEDRGKALFQLPLGSSLAMIVGMPVGRLVTAALDWRLVFFGLTLLLVLSLVLAARSLPSTAGNPVEPLGKQLAYLKNRKILVILLSCTVTFISYSMVFTYVTPYLTGTFPGLEASVGLVLMGLGVATFLGSQAGGLVVSRIGAMKTQLLGTLLQGLTLGLVFLAQGSPILTIAALVLWIFSGWLTGPTFGLNLITLAPAATGILLGLNTSAMQLGFALGSGTGGAVISLGSLQSIVWVAACIALLAVVVSFVASRLSQPHQQVSRSVYE